MSLAQVYKERAIDQLLKASAPKQENVKLTVALSQSRSLARSGTLESDILLKSTLSQQKPVVRSLSVRETRSSQLRSSSVSKKLEQRARENAAQVKIKIQMSAQEQEELFDKLYQEHKHLDETRNQLYNS